MAKKRAHSKSFKKRRPRRRSGFKKVARIQRAMPSLKHFLRIPIRRRMFLTMVAGETVFNLKVHRFMESFETETHLAYNQGNAFSSIKTRWE